MGGDQRIYYYVNLYIQMVTACDTNPHTRRMLAVISRLQP